MARRLRWVFLGVAFAFAGLGVLTNGAPAAAAPALDVDGELKGDFALRILPLLTKIGCNSGQCHGAAGGQAGFALSLRGYDADADYDAIVRESRGRRVDLDEPENSLILRKPSMRIHHKGGRKLPDDSAAFDDVRAWIAAGAPRSSPGAEDVKVVEIFVEPPERLSTVADSFDIRVKAKLSSGQVLDVTDVALISSNDESIARVNSGGKVEVAGPGETAVVARFANALGFTRVGAPFGGRLPNRPGGTGIDALVDRKLSQMGIPASPRCDDAAFLRRATLDLTGRVPTAEEVRRFLADGSASKREDLVKQLTASEDAVARWTRWLADLCRVRQESMGNVPAANLHAYLREGIVSKKPLDELLRSLVTSTGDFGSKTGVAFNFAASGPMEQMEFVTRTFVGYRFQCAQCHQHPFDRWSRQDYFGAAAFFSRARRDQGRIVLAPFGDFTDPKSGKTVAPRFPAGLTPEIPDGADRRAVFCDWMFDKNARRFDKAIVNRLWRELLGRGLVEPVDDLRDSNPASNPELLDFLALEFQSNGRGLLDMVEKIALTRAYARAVNTMTSGAEGPPGRFDRYYAHALVRPLAAAVLLDSLMRVTGVTLDSSQFQDVKYAVGLPDDDGGLYSMRAFGRCPRDGSIDPSATPPPTLSMALHFIHGPVASEWLSVKGGLVDRLTATSSTAETKVESIYLAALGRGPSAEERQAASKAFDAGDPRAAIEDLLWALLTTTEFATNH